MTQTVTATAFQRNVGRYTDQAMRETIVITSHSRERLALMPIDEYERLKALDDRVACHPADLPDYMIEALRADIEQDKTDGIIPTDMPVLKP